MTQSTFYTRDPGLLRRNEVYLEILKLGLHRIRAASRRGDHRQCEIEAHHLHNIPAYIAGGDNAFHLFYLTKEVPLYLQRIDLKVEGTMELMREYVLLWTELESLVPVRGSPWEKEWLALKARGWNYGRPTKP